MRLPAKHWPWSVPSAIAGLTVLLIIGVAGPANASTIGQIAFQASTGHLFTYDPSNNSHIDTGLGIAAGTSPSIDRYSSGFDVAFQASSTGILWTYEPANNSEVFSATFS
jgi:hypothetical protein